MPAWPCPSPLHPLRTPLTHTCVFCANSAAGLPTRSCCRAAKKAREEAQAALAGTGAAATAAQTAPAPPSSKRSCRSMEGGQNMLQVGSTLKFTPITVCWKEIEYFVPVPKGLTGAAALNVMGDDAPADVRGKKRLLHNITGAPPCSQACLGVWPQQQKQL